MRWADLKRELVRRGVKVIAHPTVLRVLAHPRVGAAVTAGLASAERVRAEVALRVASVRRRLNLASHDDIEELRREVLDLKGTRDVSDSGGSP